MKEKRADEIINFLRTYGFKDDEINKLLRNKYLSNFNLSVDNIKRKFDMFSSLGFTKEEIIKISTVSFYIFSKSVNCMKDTIKLYEDIGIKDVIIKNPRMLVFGNKIVYARYQYLASNGIYIDSDQNYSYLLLSKIAFEKKMGITNEELLEKYDYNKYLSGEEKLIRVEKPIGKEQIKDIAKMYYETRDENLRQNLIIHYMPLCQKIVSKYANDNNRDDLEQIAYLALIKTIDSYSPNNKLHISSNISKNVNDKIIQALEDHQEVESISDIEIYSNTNLEDKILDKIYVRNLAYSVIDYLDKNSSYAYIQVFKQLYGIGCRGKSIKQIMEESGYTRQYINLCEARALGKIYLYLRDKANYIPSERIISLIDSPYFRVAISKNTIEELEKVKELSCDTLDFYEDCDELKYQHSLLVKKQK